MGAELNVRMFGAAGDGCRDDSSAIQAALDAGRNGVVRIPEGVYRVSRTLCIHSDTVLRAEDGARYCRTPLFREEEMPEGSGLIENVSFEKFHVYATAVSRSGSEPMPLICAETQCRNFTIRNFSRDDALDERPDFPTVRARNLVDMRIEYAVQGEKKTVRLSEKADRLELNERFDSLSMDAGL